MRCDYRYGVPVVRYGTIEYRVMTWYLVLVVGVVHVANSTVHVSKEAMSSRAIRALRGESSRNADVVLLSIIPDFDTDDDGNEDLVERHRTASVSFAILNDESEDDLLDEEKDLLDKEEIVDIEDSKENPINRTSEEKENQSAATKSKVSDIDCEDEEDIDALLSEFQEIDRTQQRNSLLDPSSVSNESFPFDFLLKSFDTRDLDYDYTMRTSMLHAERVDDRFNQQRKLPSSSLFGSPMDGWIRPPRYVGGGIGMATYDSLSDLSTFVPPWPYSGPTLKTSLINCDEAVTSNAPEFSLGRWCTFLLSDLAARDIHDYFTIQRTGDVSSVIMFVAHHPYVTDALLQLSCVLYQTNHSSEGLSLLRRCLWIYESSSLSSLISRIIQGKVFFMDYDQKENKVFFQTLFRLIQVSSVSGLHRTSLAACRLLLSLDPLRDPMNVLLALDYHTIAVGRDYGYRNQIDLLRWLVELVELDLIHIWYRDKDEGSRTTYRCSLVELPNWAYSYALALFDLHNAINNCCGDDIEVLDTRDFENFKCKADTAIQSAMSRYPAVVRCLLHNLDIDTSGRSFHRDWLPVLEKISVIESSLVSDWQSGPQSTLILSATLQTCDLITKIYVQQSSRLYADDNIVRWIYDNLVDLFSKERCLLPVPPNAAILRYASVDPTDYDVKIQFLPPDANAIDARLLAHAMLINPNRPRYLRQFHRREDRQNEINVDERAFGNRAHHIQPSYFGPPAEMVDPDWPLLEVFWRSLLPWSYVEGMPPPR